MGSGVESNQSFGCSDRRTCSGESDVCSETGRMLMQNVPGTSFWCVVGAVMLVDWFKPCSTLSLLTPIGLSRRMDASKYVDEHFLGQSPWKQKISLYLTDVAFRLFKEESYKRTAFALWCLWEQIWGPLWKLFLQGNVTFVENYLTVDALVLQSAVVKTHSRVAAKPRQL